MSRPTILDVARKAGVGVGTVSRVINNSPRVRPETRDRVLVAIQELGFKPNTVARQLPRKTRLRNIGVITQPFINYYSFVERLRGVQQALSTLDKSYELVLYNIMSPESYEDRLAFIVRTGMIDGLLIIDFDLSDDQVEMLTRAHLPFVGLNEFRDRSWPCIGCDNVAGGELATAYLLELGHTRIAYVGDEFVDAYGFYTSSERYEGYCRALQAQGVAFNDDYVQLGRHGYEQAKSLTATLLALPQPPTAIFAMSDRQALGCIAAVREAGLRVPEDVSVIGYDDLEVSLHTGLTTVNQHLVENGMMGVQYLLEIMRASQEAPLPDLPPLTVIPRQTTQPFARSR